MLSRFLQISKEESLFTTKQNLCIAVSGGVDSMILMDLLHKGGFRFSVAHCNFHLRDLESDGDAEFVSAKAKQMDVPFFSIDFDTENYAKEKSISIEMAARELRYDWFESLRKLHQFDAILVGHHRDDVLETFFLNLARGTGIRGLSGIERRNGYIVRPLLDFSRDEILAYAEKHDLPYREDSSNSSTKYLRNLVRHEVLPTLEKLNPAFRSNMINSIAHLNDMEEIALAEIDKIRQKVVTKDEDAIKISIEELRKLHPRKTYLFELLRPYQFGADHIENIHRSIDLEESGKQFLSKTHRIVRDRDHLLLTPFEKKQNSCEFYFSKQDNEVSEPIHFSMEISEMDDSFSIIRDAHIALLDFDKLSADLTLRHWKEGDRFQPLGMKGKKKVSDFFVDQKFSLLQKEEAWILTSRDKIVWIVGHRLDDQFKVTKKTKTILKIRYHVDK